MSKTISRKLGGSMKLKKYTCPCITLKSSINFTFLTQYIFDASTCFQDSNWPLVIVTGNEIQSCGPGPTPPFSVSLQCSETGSETYQFTIVSDSLGGSINCAAIGAQNILQILDSIPQGLPAFCTITSQLNDGEEVCLQQ